MSARARRSLHNRLNRKMRFSPLDIIYGMSAARARSPSAHAQRRRPRDSVQPY